MYVKQPAVKPRGNPCTCCPDPKRHAPLNTVLMVGFGCCQVTRDGELVYEENAGWLAEGWDHNMPPTLMVVESHARHEPTCDWRLVMYGPLHGEEYQRQDDCEGPSKWVCIDSNQGFA